MSAQETQPIPIIDTHIHLFDTTRPQGVPWPEKSDAVLYHPALPQRYREVTSKFHVRGAIEVEASPWLEDNQWVLDVAAKDTIIVGTVGDLEPGKPEFAGQLERFHKNPLFRGIRYGNLWDRSLTAEMAKPAFVADLKRVAQAGLVLDSANPTVELMGTLVQVSDKVPDLRIVVDHLPQLDPPEDAAGRSTYQQNLRELGKRPQIYVKLSAVLRRAQGRVPEELSFYRPRLDDLLGVFGEDRILFGSDWPNCDQWGPYPTVLGLVHQYFSTKERSIAEKYFWKNSIAAYRWIKRDSGQPALA